MTESPVTVDSRKGQITVTVEDIKPVAVPLEDVAVVLFGTESTISTSALVILSKYDVSALVCDWRGVPVSALYSWSDHTRVGARQRAQVESSIPTRKQIWAKLISAKISGQAWVLRCHNIEGYGHLQEMSNSVKSGDNGNLEGVAAAFYWRRFNGGIVRDRDSTDSVNSALNYGYTVLRGHAIRAVLSAGLHPGIGVFHRGHANPFALADDLIEPFRPAVDDAVLSLLPYLNMSDQEHKRVLVKSCSAVMGGGAKTVTSEMDMTAKSIGTFLEDKTRTLHVSKWRG